MEAVEEIEADQFKEHIDYRANAYVAEVQAVDVEVRSGGPKGGGHKASELPGSHGGLARHALREVLINYPKNSTSNPLQLPPDGGRKGRGDGDVLLSNVLREHGGGDAHNPGGQTCAVGAPIVAYIDPGGQLPQAVVPHANPLPDAPYPGGRPQHVGAPTFPYFDPGGRPQVVGAPTVPNFDPGGRSQAIGAPTSSLRGRHDGRGGAEQNPLPDVDVLSDHRDLVPDRGAPDTDVIVDPGGRPHGVGAPTKPNVAVHHRSYGGRGGGRFKNNHVRSQECGGGRTRFRGAIKDRGRFLVCISDPRRYRANRGRFRSFIKKFINIKKFNNIKKFSEARDLLRLLVMGPVSPI